MAPDLKKSQKRKAAQASAPPIKKAKKASPRSIRKSIKEKSELALASGALPVETPAEQPAEQPAPVPAVRKSSRKRATDFFDGGDQQEQEIPKSKKPKKAAKSEKVSEPAAEAPVVEDDQTVVSKAAKPATTAAKAKASKKSQSNGAAAVETDLLEENPKAKASKSTKKAKSNDAAEIGGVELEEPPKSKKPKRATAISKTAVDPAVEVEEDQAEPLEDGDSDVELEEDQTAALLKGFESSEDEADISHDEGFEKGKPVPALPQDKTLQKKLKSANASDKDEPGVVYVGRIPHGFYEHEMRDYFSQFGKISKLRLSRNPKTGASKHYAFLEFASGEVAQIVADTMNNYLMFGHILKCQVIPIGRVHPELWKGANRRFKKVPWSKLEGKKLAAAKPREIWKMKVGKERSKREKMTEKLQALGYEYELPLVKGIEEVPPREAEKLIEAGEVEDGADKSAAIVQAPKDDKILEETTTVERGEPNAVVVTEEVSTRKGKKTGNETEGTKSKSKKKSKKAT
ncbi:MAG: hypothetical protein M4579_005266 [Chaenotheca gracillima]|nr:MAG: hypothetical protein M4579_005266 [Chaenotheca gracillima]